MGHGGARPWRRQDFDLVGRERHIGEAHGSVAVDLECAFARGGHHGGHLRPQLPPDLREQRLDATFHELRLVADQLDRLDVHLVGDQLEQRLPLRELAAGQRKPHKGQGLTDLQTGLTTERSGQLDRAASRGHRRLEPLVPVPRKLGTRPAGQVDAVGRCRIVRHHQVLIHRLGQEGQHGREDPRRRDERLVQRGERVRPPVRRVAPGKTSARAAQVPGR